MSLAPAEGDVKRGRGCYNRAMDRNREQIAAEIVKFAQDNKLKIHPGQEPQKWADLVIKNIKPKEKDVAILATQAAKGASLPLNPTGRTAECPCEFALGDIKELRITE